jgi:hypothetical protein
MNLMFRTDFGCIEAVIDEECSLKRFYEIANVLTDDLEIRFIKKWDDMDSIMWEFSFRRQPLTLHYNIYTGVSIFPQRFMKAEKRENEAVVEVARILQVKLFSEGEDEEYLS